MVQKTYRTFIFLFIAFTVFISFCSNPSEPKDKPVWLNTFLHKMEQEHNYPVEIWKYDWNGKTVYYSIADCCDQFNHLLDEDGKVICSPNGGYTGNGDGKCPDFWNEKKNGKLIWKKKQ